MVTVIFINLVILCIGLVHSAPNSLVLSTLNLPPLPTSTTPLPYSFDPGVQVDPGFNPVLPNFPQDVEKETEPIIYEFNINSNISNRFATTLVTSKVKNDEVKAKEATFTVVLPEKAFISGFVMEIDGKSYKAYVKEKEEAKKIYEQAIQSGQSAGHVAVSARDSNIFTVSINVEPEKKATFLLTYEELLERRNNQYELVLNIHPRQIVPNMNIEVFINESRPLKFVRSPTLRSGNEISKNDDKLDPDTDITFIKKTTAVAKFSPTEDQQKIFAKGLGGKENEGLSGQFVLQYDVERDPNGGEVLLQDGYFVHFFAPAELEPLPKHIVFVLDTSGSMYGTKIIQLREAMVSILDELNELDTFHIVEFNTGVYVWNIEKQERIYAAISNNAAPFEDLSKQEYPDATPATKEGIEKGKLVIQKLKDDSLTDILSSLEAALYLVNRNLNKNKDDSRIRQPIIVFLTDGDPTVGNSNTEEITKIITKFNSEKDQAPIFSLSFGEGADKNFLRKVSLKNNGFSRHIYEAADASLQLQEFYKEISSPLLSNVQFKYTSEVKQVTKIKFPIYFQGCELVSAGRVEGSDLKFDIIGSNRNGTTTLSSIVETPVTPLERIWAYLTIKKKLEERELTDNKTQLTKEALDLALKYSFVTDVSSLVVVKPNDTSAVDLVDASKSNRFGGGYPYGSPPLYSPGMPGPPPPPQYAAGVPGPPRGGFAPLSIHGLSAPVPTYGYPQSAMQCTGPGCSRPISGYYQTTSIPILSTTEEDPAPLSVLLPWLKTELSSNNTLSINGTQLLLVEGTQIYDIQSCTGTPINPTESGVCSLLNDCRHVLSLLTSFQTYTKFACTLDDKYAGVCCPPVPPA